MSYFRDNIEAMQAYVPGEQPAGLARIIKLNTNENPYPPSPAVARALAEFSADALRVYPDPRVGTFVRAVSDVLGVDREMIQAANGSDNLLVMIARAALQAGRSVAYPGPTFPFYETQARIADAKILEVPFEPEYSFPLQGLIDAAASVTFVANPNSPTGTTASVQQLETLAESLRGVGLLVVDEAYVDFADATAVKLPSRYENVIVLRTLSKGYSLAGLRLGYAVAQPGALEQLWKTKEIYNVGMLADQLGAAAFRDQEYMQANVAKIKASREKLSTDLQALGWTVWPSQANFILARPPAGDAKGIYETLQADGIFVRYFQHPDLADKLRITIGTEEQNAEFLKRIG
ncbi:MAG: histidinol-phosphate transaminase [Phycisphaerae bacterium]|nr:histidinol-phosphate transaminase [Phycisphaerae bacterium]